MLKIVFWNINGMGKEVIRSWIKSMVCDQRMSFLYIQKSKAILNFDGQVISVWVKHDPIFVALDSIGNSGGIIMIWDQSLFQLTNVIKEGPCRVINVNALQTTSGKKRLWDRNKGFGSWQSAYILDYMLLF